MRRAGALSQLRGAPIQKTVFILEATAKAELSWHFVMFQVSPRAGCTPRALEGSSTANFCLNEELQRLSIRLFHGCQSHWWPKPFD